MKRRIVIAAFGVTFGCASGRTVPAVRFANAPAVAVVDDRRDVPTQPDARLFLPDLYFFDGTFQRLITRTLEVHRPQRALGVNALDEVPNSTWFINRVGTRELTPDQVRIGPLSTDSPELHKPWTIHSTKVGGTSVGFIVKDSRGIKYMIKFDGTAFPELETAAHVIVNRLLWASGYNVPEDQIVYIRAEDLELEPNSAVKDLLGRETGKLDRAELDRELSTVFHEPDGTIRALASRWLDGKPLGGHPSEGVREDDPNDRIPHELRRDLRGAYPIFAWLDHVDVTEGNFLDAWTTDPANPKRRYVKHYAIDFGKSLGVMGAVGFDWRRGESYMIDFPEVFRSLVTLGIAERRWEQRSAPELRGVASLFEANTFDPGGWRPDTAGYIPFLTSDRFDKFWGAKIVARFTREQIRAAVDAGRLSDPRAAAYMTDTLVARQRAVARYWFQRVDPLDHFTVAPDASLCFDDLAIAHALAPLAKTRYAITTYDFGAHEFGTPIAVGVDPQGHACSAPVVLAGDRAGYTILRVETTRPGFTAATFVHIARDPSSGQPRVIGISR